jgi:hypothetical protein
MNDDSLSMALKSVVKKKEVLDYLKRSQNALRHFVDENSHLSSPERKKLLLNSQNQYLQSAREGITAKFSLKQVESGLDHAISQVKSRTGGRRSRRRRGGSRRRSFRRR